MGVEFVVPALTGDAIFFCIDAEAPRIADWLRRRGVEARVEDLGGEGVTVAFGERRARLLDWLIDCGGGHISVARPYERVGETFTWDGTDEGGQVIQEALRPVLGPDTMAYAPDFPLHIYDMDTGRTHGYVPPQGRVRIEGDSIAVLPPEEETR